MLIALLVGAVSLPGYAPIEASLPASELPTITPVTAAVERHQPLGSPVEPLIDPRPTVDSVVEPPDPAPYGRGPAQWTLPPYRVTYYRIRTIAPGALPYTSSSLPPKTVSGPHDAAGIPMKLVGTKLYYSPAGLMQYAISMEDAYRRTRDPDYLAIATKVLNKMMAIGVRSNGGVYLPYLFDFAMHRIATEVMEAPWYSAMAQGLALTLAIRLYRDTGNATFLNDADLLFASFRHVGRGSSPWVTYIDAGRYLWLEEYPEKWTPSDHTANGFMFAVFGLYDYYQTTRNRASLQVLRASLTTMRHYISQFRRPGTYSNYCLRHGRPQPKYHKIVTWQLVFLYRMSGDTYFNSMANLFRSDYH
ncbi:MAG: D-glucuronyl C5-epimerase family protein [Candidatus Limnocylindrales bacterium]